MSIFPVLAVALILSLSYFLSNSFLSGLQDVPGPFLAKFSNLWRLIETWKGHYEHVMQDLHERHGDIVRVGPNVVSLTNPEAIERIYGNRADLPKSDFYKVMQNYHNGKLVPTLLTVTDRKVHTRLRKPVNNIFNMNTITQFEPLIDVAIRDLVRVLHKQFVDGHKVCDIDHWLQYYAFDVISGLSFSRPFGFLEHGHDMNDMMKHLARVFKYCAIIGQMPVLDKFLAKNPLLRRFALGTSPFSIRAGNLFKNRVDEESKGRSSDRQDFVARILEIKKNSPDEVPDEAVVGYIMTILLAGSDTVSITLRSIVYYLSKDLGIQKKLQKEIDEAGLKHPVAWRDAQGLAYLDAVVLEALRIHPPTSILLERVVSPRGLSLPDGRTLKPGTIVSMNGWTINQNQRIFGEDANVFNPDRWLKDRHETEEQFKERIRAMKRADIAFGYGPRSCLGKPIAQLEIYKLVPTLFGLFDMRLASPQKPWQYLSYFVTEQHDMDVILTMRNGVEMTES